MQNIILAIILSPLIAAIIVGFLGRQIGHKVAHWLTIVGVAIAFVLSCVLFKYFIIDGNAAINFNVYHWLVSGNFNFNIGFLIDRLSVMMLVVVTFISLLVHIYSVGYMQGDLGYQRFFSYISAFTFAMLMLVTANNFLQLFFGWEGVGLISYLLIGFWFDREAANFGSLKAFIVNRVGDFGFILGIGGVLTFFGTLDFAQVFAVAPQLAADSVTINIFMHTAWSIISVICILLFIGAMGKSAQMPLHVWLPESMEGPTPISALIHAATMVTAGVYMVARLSPLYELSASALSFMLIIGAITALFTGILGIVQNDIKRVIAYSTLSQLGYMVAALGVSAYAASIFHLISHAAFKALLFLAAGSVILAMHHQQDMRNMGGLAKRLPITYSCFLLGALSLTAIPPFSGFYSKDAIIEAVRHSHIVGANDAYIMLVVSAFFTALYIFRALFMTFHGQPRMTKEIHADLKENSPVIWLPLVILAIPTVFIGMLWVKPMLYQTHGWLSQAIYVAPQHNVLAQLATHYPGIWRAAWHGLNTSPCWAALLGIIVAWLCYYRESQIPAKLTRHCSWLYLVLIKKYGFDDFNQIILVHGTRKLATIFYQLGDLRLIDGYLVNGSGRVIRWLSLNLKRMQSGYLYHYALAMIIGVIVLAFWQILIR